MLANIHGVPHRPTGVDSRDILHVVDTPKIGIPGSGIHNCVADGPPVAFAPISESLELTIPEIPHHRVVWVRMSGIRGLFRILPTGNEAIPYPAAVLNECPTLCIPLPKASQPDEPN